MNISYTSSLTAFSGNHNKAKKNNLKRKQEAAEKSKNEFKTYGIKTRYDDITEKIRVDERLAEISEQIKAREAGITLPPKKKIIPIQTECIMDTINKIKRQAITLKNMRKMHK